MPGFSTLGSATSTYNVDSGFGCFPKSIYNGGWGFGLIVLVPMSGLELGPGPTFWQTEEKQLLNMTRESSKRINFDAVYI